MVGELEKNKKFVHLLNVPFTGLGMYGGFRGNRWLRNRIKVFTHFVIPSLLAQTNQSFTLWISWRPEEKRNKYVQGFMEFLGGLDLDVVHTFHGLCFWDDKYKYAEARDRLLLSLQNTVGELTDSIGECDYVLMTIQPSDDLYHNRAVADVQTFLQSDYQAVGYTKGYMMNYLTKEIAEYNPDTNPPFFTIKFPREVFIDPLKHIEYTGPYQSHEYVGETLRYRKLDDRGFIVGTHGENVSTVWNHPFRGDVVNQGVLQYFGLTEVEPLTIKTSWRKKILRRLPHKVQRKLRYIFGEKLFNKLYEFLRS